MSFTAIHPGWLGTTSAIARHGIRRRPRLRILSVAAAVAATVGGGATAADRVPEAEQQATRSVVADYRNPLTLEMPAPAPVGALAFFGGAVFGAVGETVPAAAPADDGGRRLLRASFGQPFSAGIPDLGIETRAVDRARKYLYYSEGELTGVDDPDNGTFLADAAAYRYRDLIYGKIQVRECVADLSRTCSTDADCDDGDTCGAPVDRVVNLLESRIADGLSTIADFYGDTERERSRDAEREVRDALKVAPLSASLRGTLLDIYYDRVVAELSLARELRLAATRERIQPAIVTDAVVDQEIARLETTLGTADTPGGLRYALAGYFELLNDPLGVEVGTFDPAMAGAVFGTYLLRDELPGRSLRAATYLDPGGVPTPVTPGGQPGETPPVLYDGYKDLVLLFEAFADYAELTSELALRYVERNGQDDMQRALDLTAEAESKLYLEGSLLLGLAPDEGVAINSGLDESIRRWERGISRLAATRNTIAGGANALGFDDDFLMLVVTDEPGETTFDTFLEETRNGLSGVLDLAEEKYERAQASFDSYRGHRDQLAGELAALRQKYDLRIFEVVGTSDSSDPLYLTPLDNEGSEIQLQWLSIQIAQERVRRNTVRLQNVKREVEIEIDRVGKELGIRSLISDVIISYGNQQAALTQRIGDIEADQILVEGVTTAAKEVLEGAKDAFLTFGASAIAGAGQAVETGINTAFQVDAQNRKTRLQVQKEKKAADERATLNDLESRVTSVNSFARVKTLLLAIHEIAVDSQEAALELEQEQARLTALFSEWAELEQRRDRAATNLTDRYFADPVHRLRFDSRVEDADFFFRYAQKWVYFLARALEYKFNIRLDELAGGGLAAPDGEFYNVDSIYRARTALELDRIVTALVDYDNEAQTIVPGQRSSWFSVRDDALQLNGDVDRFLQALQESVAADPDGDLVLQFSTAMVLDGRPLYNTDNFNDRIESVQLNVPGLTVPLTGTLSYGGTSFVRNQQAGVPDPSNPDRLVGEERVYSTRYWFKNLERNVWEFTDDQRAAIQLSPSASSQVIPAGVPEVRDFQQRSVAATAWTLKLNLPIGFDLSQMQDIEIFFSHRSATRQ